VGARPYGSVVTALAAAEPGRPAVVCEGESLTRGELESRANRMARAFEARGVGPGDLVGLALPNSLELVVGCVAAWKLGAVPTPLSHRLPHAEREKILARAAPKLVVGCPAPAGAVGLPARFAPDPSLSDAPLPDAERRVPPHERALASGGSTGLPKLILPKSPGLYDDADPSRLFAAKRAMLVPGPIHHAAPFSACFQALLGGATVVLMARFDAARCLELVERHRVDRMTVVPTMMLRIWRLPEAERRARDVSSLEFVMTGGAPCPPWLMRAWIDWLGPDVMHEAFGPSERIGGTFITGREWLAHPGSVGRPLPGTTLEIRDPETGAALPPGEMGEIWALPPGGPGSTYRYLGARGRRADDGFESVGDMGWLDADGYLYLGDRRTDMILVGGRNVYPAEVEGALEEHPSVRSACVIGLPGRDVAEQELGQRIHALVECEGALDEAALRAHLAERLERWKTPHSFERVDGPLRDEAGKLRRHRLREARL
jgi:bile acid-coenzyme A ligase